MALETGTYISDLVITNPVSADPKSQGDDHLRLLKSTVKATFPNVTGAVTGTQAELNIIDGATLTTAELNKLTGATLTTAELNKLTGATLSTTELNYVTGVTSAIQTQMNLKAPLASPTLTGIPAAPTASAGATGAQIATLDFVNAVGFSSSLPGQTGNSGKLLGTNGTNASWGSSLDVAVVAPSTGTAFATTTGAQTLTDKTATDLILANAADVTKKASFVLSGLSAGQNRTITLADEAIVLFTPGWRRLTTVTASNSATADVETTFSSTYDEYIIEATGVTVQTLNAPLRFLMKIGGSYVTTGYYQQAENTAAITNGANGELVTNCSITAGVSYSFSLRVSSPASALMKGVFYSGVACEASSTTPRIQGATINTGTGALTGIRFQCGTGNIVSGTFRLYGIRKT